MPAVVDNKPTVATEEQLEKLQFKCYQEAVLSVLKQSYGWSPRFLGHHHNRRCKAVCAAIQKATKYEQIANIIENQAQIFLGQENRLDFSDLPQCWSDINQLKRSAVKEVAYQYLILVARANVASENLKNHVLEKLNQDHPSHQALIAAVSAAKDSEAVCTVLENSRMRKSGYLQAIQQAQVISPTYSRS